MPELIWDGKYDAAGKRVAIPKTPLPFQTIETVNEDTHARERSLSLFESGEPSDWRNRLIWGDKKWVLPSLLPEFGSKVDLIYIDPPFDTGADFSFSAPIPADPNAPENAGQSFTKEPSLLELKAYRDIWGGAKTHLDAYLKWFYETVVVLYDLLAPTGSIYVHLDYRMVHYARSVLDEIFGSDRFINEIIWKRRTGTVSSNNAFGAQTDSILWYSKSEKFTFNPQFRRSGISQEEIEKKFNLVDEQGRRYWSGDLNNPGDRPNLKYDYKGYAHPKGGWAISREVMEKWDAEGKIIFPKNPEGRIRRKMYLHDWQGYAVQNLWEDISPVNSQAKEAVGYPTQKSEALLERIIKASSNEGDLVLDCFCGSGTTAAVSEKLKRRWITCDLGRFAIHTARKRLLAIPELVPFQVLNLGKYERQAWKTDSPYFSKANEHQKLLDYRKFILALYHATPLEGYSWLHGVKNGRFVHVGSIDSPVSEGDITQIALEWKRATGGAGESPQTNGIDVLGWEFAFELNDLKKQQAQRANLLLSFKRIPREVMEKRAADSGEIQFFELAALDTSHAVAAQTLTLELKNFIAPLDYLPADVQGSITSWEQMVDYWAIDWDYQGDTFHNQWQSYRTKASPKLERVAKFTYDGPGVRRVVVKVIDILGNDTSRMVEIGVE